MKRRRIFIIGSLIFLSFFSCNREDELPYMNYEPKIAVEGWIENGTTATVLLTWTASFDQAADTAYLLNQIIRSAKVSVSNGEQTEILTMGTQNQYIPPYVYYGRTIKGEVGKSYRLTIEYHNEVITAETFIPKPVPLTNCWFVKESPDELTGYINIRFQNTSDAYYQIATREREPVFVPCLYGNIASSLFKKDEWVTLQVNKGPVLYPETRFETYFLVGDLIELKFRTQTKESYDFWTSYQNEALNAQNPIFPAHTNLKSNIKGGIGIWCGYGTYNYYIYSK